MLWKKDSQNPTTTYPPQVERGSVTNFIARSMEEGRAGARAGASWRGAGVRIEMDEEGGREREVGCVSVMFML
jgi:hypothetical protein